MAYEFTLQKVEAERKALVRNLAIAALAGGAVFVLGLLTMTDSAEGPGFADLLRVSVLATVAAFGAFYLARRLTSR